MGTRQKEQKEEDPMERDLAAFRQRVTQRPITEGQPLPDLGWYESVRVHDSLLGLAPTEPLEDQLLLLQLCRKQPNQGWQGHQ